MIAIAFLSVLVLQTTTEVLETETHSNSSLYVKFVFISGKMAFECWHWKNPVNQWYRSIDSLLFCKKLTVLILLSTAHSLERDCKFFEAEINYVLCTTNIFTLAEQFYKIGRSLLQPYIRQNLYFTIWPLSAEFEEFTPLPTGNCMNASVRRTYDWWLLICSDIGWDMRLYEFSGCGQKVPSNFRLLGQFLVNF